MRDLAVPFDCESVAVRLVRVAGKQILGSVESPALSTGTAKTVHKPPRHSTV